jgi:hypothetical protein
LSLRALRLCARNLNREGLLKKGMRKWTVMVYLAGDNNLDGAGVVDLTEMKKAGSNGDVA